MRVLGIDLAWGSGSDTVLANETGLVAADPVGRIVDAGWARGVDEVISWIGTWAEPDTLAMIDAPLIVDNPSGQRLCETQVGQRYGRWKVSANSTNLGSPRLAGVDIGERLEGLGWSYEDGRYGPRDHGRVLSEVYPYTTIVGAEELGFEVERPLYKRKPKALRTAEFRHVRAAACDGLIAAVDGLRDADPPIDLRSHPATETLVAEPSPLDDRPYKHREDLLDAVLCAWTGLLWLRHGVDRCQVLGLGEGNPGRPEATIIAPARPEQRRA
jgi:predicted RNase H-like nuclease